MSVSQPTHSPTEAVILIHGIGDLEPQSVLTAACRAIQRLAPDAKVSMRKSSADDETKFESGQAHIDEVNLTWRNQHYRLIEYYWAQIPGKIRARHPFRALRQILETLKDFPSMSLGPSTSPGFAKLATWCGRAQQALVVGTILLAIMAVGEGLLHAERQTFLDAMEVMEAGANLDRQGMATKQVEESVNKAFRVLWSTFPLFTILLGVAIGVLALEMFLILGCLVFPFAGLVAGAGWKQFNLLWRNVTASSLLMMASILMLFFLVQWTLMGWGFLAVAQSDQAFDWSEFYVAGSIGVLMFLGMGKFGLICANLLRDIIHYLARDARGQPLTTQQTIQDELWNLIQRLRSDEGITHMVCVAHSLGSVILVDLLRRQANKEQPGLDVHIDIVTAGSPLRRMIARLLPHRFPLPAQLYEDLGGKKSLKLDRWFNVYRVLDYVGQSLTSRRDPRHDRYTIGDFLLQPWYRPPFGHSNYWEDERFVRFLATQVLALGRESAGNHEVLD